MTWDVHQAPKGHDPLPEGVSATGAVTMEELRLAARNHGMPLEALRYDITPLGLHYLLIHFDIPVIDPRAWRLAVSGQVERPLSLTLEDLQSRAPVTLPVTFECAGNGRARLDPRPVSQPWLDEAVGTAEWTGTPLRGVLEDAGVLGGAVEVLFTGHDRGVQGGIEQDYERSLPLAEALRDEVMLAWAINGQPLLPQHGFPLRVVVPGWYGMAQVKWLKQITVLDRPFAGYQQVDTYQVKASEEDPGAPVTRIAPRSLMIPPGIPDFMSRVRLVDPGDQVLRGRAWSGLAPVTRVEVSADGGTSWHEADLGEPLGRWAWAPWSFAWRAETLGEHLLCSRATDRQGNVQPVDPPWNLQGMANNMVQHVRVVVRVRAG